MNKENKPIIETIINTAALAITAFGTQQIINGNYYGFMCVIFGMIIEYFKYFGRHKNLW